MIGSFAPFFLLVFFLSPVAGRASRDSRGKGARPTQPTRGGVSIHRRNQEQPQADVSRTAPQRRKHPHSLSEAVFLRARSKPGSQRPRPIKAKIPLSRGCGNL